MTAICALCVLGYLAIGVWLAWGARHIPDVWSERGGVLVLVTLWLPILTAVSLAQALRWCWREYRRRAGVEP